MDSTTIQILFFTFLGFFIFIGAQYACIFTFFGEKKVRSIDENIIIVQQMQIILVSKCTHFSSFAMAILDFFHYYSSNFA